MEPLTIQRDVVKHGVRLDCLIEGMAYSAEREEVRNQRLAGVECVEIAEKTGLPVEQVIDYCRELGLPEVGNCHLIPPNMTKGKVCPVCGKPVLQKVGGVRRFCSKECKDEYERKHYKSLATGRTAICQNCGREFKAVHECNGQRRFCSRECYFEFRYGLKEAKQDE